MNQRDLEMLSAYLDGQLTPSDSARLEARLTSDRELVSTLDDLRAARTLLRKLPKRRAPRNFTLTRKMVGLNPPLPRAYPAFRFATTLATLLFFITFSVNALAPQFQQSFGFGMGGGGEPDTFAQQAPALEAAAATEAPATEAPAATEESVSSAADVVPQGTALPPSEDSSRVIDTPTAKDGAVGNAEGEDQTQIANEAPSPASFIPSGWMIIFAVVALLGSIFMVVMRRSSINRWK
jgi:anti-sigma factor RsiW